MAATVSTCPEEGLPASTRCSVNLCRMRGSACVFCPEQQPLPSPSFSRLLSSLLFFFSPPPLPPPRPLSSWPWCTHKERPALPPGPLAGGWGPGAGAAVLPAQWPPSLRLAFLPTPSSPLECTTHTAAFFPPCSCPSARPLSGLWVSSWLCLHSPMKGAYPIQQGT